jgi:hypothetical protein
MKLNHIQTKAVSRAEKSLRAAKQLWWKVLLYCVAVVGLWLYFDREREFIVFGAYGAFFLLGFMFFRLVDVLRELLAVFQELINADPQALAQQYSTKLGNDDPESLIP